MATECEPVMDLEFARKRQATHIVCPDCTCDAWRSYRSLPKSQFSEPCPTCRSCAPATSCGSGMSSVRSWQPGRGGTTPERVLDAHWGDIVAYPRLTTATQLAHASNNNTNNDNIGPPSWSTLALTCCTVSVQGSTETRKSTSRRI